MPTQLPSGMWRAQVFVGYNEKGKRMYKSFLAETKELAQLEALKFSTTLSREKTSSLILKKAINDYIKIKTPVLSPSTIRGYTTIRSSLAAYYPELLKMRLYEIDTKALQRAVNVLAEDLSAKTVRNCFYLVNAVLNYNGYEPHAPTLPKLSRPEMNIPDAEVMKRLYQIIKGTNMEVPVLLAALAPMRRGEIVAASIKDLGDDNVLYVHRAAVVDVKGRQTIKDYPKTDESNRHILLPAFLADLIRKQGYVTRLSVGTISKRFHALLEANDIPTFRFHDLRHAFVSIAHAAGIPDAYIMSRGGWATSYTMNRVYRHTLDSEQKVMEEKINDVFGNVLQDVNGEAVLQNHVASD